jgi:Tol biopolymer transport system component
MTGSSRATLERIARRVPVPDPAYERLLRRRDRKERRRVSAGVLAIALALVSVTVLIRAFGSTERPAAPTPTPTGIFSGMGGWIAYGDVNGIWAVDPRRSGDPSTRVRLNRDAGDVLAWSNDGSKLLIVRGSTNRRESVSEGRTLSVLDANGTETVVVNGGAPRSVSGGSFTPDGTMVVYAAGDDFVAAGATRARHRAGIYEVDVRGGQPRLLLAAGRRWFPDAHAYYFRGLGLPTLSPDGSQIAYVDGFGDWGNTLRVMNADGSGSHIIFAQLPAHIEHLAWLPDGQHLAFDSPAGEIDVVGTDGSGPRRLVYGSNAHWSPDGVHISFDTWTLQIASLDGTARQTFDPGRSGPWNPLGGQSRELVASVGAPEARDGMIVGAVAILTGIGLFLSWRRRRGELVAGIEATGRTDPMREE